MLVSKGFASLFPRQREVIFRSQGKVRYFRVGRITQISSLGLAIIGLSWSVYATSLHLSHQSVIASRNSAIIELQRENSELSGNLADIRNKATIQELSLSATKKTGVKLVANNQALQFKLAAAEKKLKERTEEGRALSLSYLAEAAAHAHVAADLTKLESSQDDIEQRLEDREHRLAASDAERARLGETIVTTDVEMHRLKEEVSKLNYARLDLISRLDKSHGDLQRAVQDKLKADGERKDLGAEVVDLSNRLETIETAQVGIVSRLGEQAGESGDALKRTLTIAGLDVDHLLDRLSRSDGPRQGVGGPFLSLDDKPGSQLVYEIATVNRRIDDFQRLQDLMERLPLATPLDEFRLTSGYGKRIDPFTSRFALHSGIDLASRKRAPVHVTSPGVVTFVGWRGGFGKIVEVDHGLGIRTRYAHLSNIYVKRGQKVEFREKVGQIGSTGRSTGEHLHYEVIVDGRSQDPAGFIKAGQYVFKK
ncbi:MAG: peptidoglycan DD-metalloendopeptidase family protein [Alphaproteobacteria bacterium]|nr:peptidoglycan DD-metalloendopeptidase family protein [Alphaproteobacteria bacterium]